MIYLIREPDRVLVQNDRDTCPLNFGPKELHFFLFRRLGSDWTGTVEELPQTIRDWYAANTRVLPGLAKPPNRDRITTWIQELAIYGYALMAISRKTNGQLNGYDWHIYEASTQQIRTRRSSVKPLPGVQVAWSTAQSLRYCDTCKGHMLVQKAGTCPVCRDVLRPVFA